MIINKEDYVVEKYLLCLFSEVSFWTKKPVVIPVTMDLWDYIYHISHRSLGGIGDTLKYISIKSSICYVTNAIRNILEQTLEVVYFFANYNLLFPSFHYTF